MKAPLFTHWPEDLTQNAKFFYMGFLKTEKVLDSEHKAIIPEPFYFSAKGSTKMHVYFVDLNPGEPNPHKVCYIFYSPHFANGNSSVSAFISHNFSPAASHKMKRLNKKDLK